MKINKILWIFALVLLAGLPGVFAQSIFENPWFIFAVNVFIVWIVLFILQALLMAGKPDKERVVVWVITIALAVLIAWVFVGFSDYIWKAGPIAALFNPVVLVNTVIISLAAYFSLGLLGVKIESTQGKIGALILIVLFAGLISATTLPDYIWKTETLEWFYKFLLDEKDGILRPDNNRLYVFIAALILFSWLFLAGLNLGGEKGNSKLSYAMAFIIASNLAHTGTTLETMIKVGEIFTIIIIAKQLGGKLFGSVIATALVAWLSIILFPGKGIASWLWQNVVPGAITGWKDVVHWVTMILLAFAGAAIVKNLIPKWFGGK